jgi:hypothetical protein
LPKVEPVISTREIQQEIEPCPNDWNFGKSADGDGHVSEIKINDSTTKLILDGKVWFEVINPVESGNGSTKCYIKNYRTDGILDSEGYGIYNEHPVVDLTNVGKWRFYDCSGSLVEEAEFINGKRKN